MGRTPGQQADQRRPEVAEQVGHAHEVGEDVVAVQPDGGQELPQGLAELAEQGDQQPRLARVEVDQAQPGQGDDVEVHAPEVGAQPSDPAQPVGVGDRAVERRPDDVQPDAHVAGAGTAVAAGGDGPELVEGPCGDGEDVDGQEQLGGADDLVHPGQDLGQQVPPGNDPGQHRHEGGQRRHPHRPEEERTEESRDAPGDLGRHDTDPVAQRQQEIG